MLTFKLYDYVITLSRYAMHNTDPYAPLLREDASNFEALGLDERLGLPRYRDTTNGHIYYLVDSASLDTDSMELIQKKTPAFSFQAPRDFAIATIADGETAESVNTVHQGQWVSVNIHGSQETYAERVAHADTKHYDIYPNGTFLANYNPGHGQAFVGWTPQIQSTFVSDLIQCGIPQDVAVYAAQNLREYAYEGAPALAAQLPFNVVMLCSGQHRTALAGAYVKENGKGDYTLLSKESTQNTHGLPEEAHPFVKTHPGQIAAGLPLVAPLRFTDETQQQRLEAFLQTQKDKA